MVDEDISRRTIALSIRTGKLTARTLAWALRAAGRKIQKERQAHQTPHGRQTVRQLMKQGEATNSLPVEAPREFDRVARRWNVDYAFYKNGEGKYLLFFKSKQADAITACFGEYSRRVMDRSRVRRAPILERMKRAGELLRQRPQKLNGAPAKSQDFVGRGAATERADFGGIAAEGAERSLQRRAKEAEREER